MFSTIALIIFIIIAIILIAGARVATRTTHNTDTTSAGSPIKVSVRTRPVKPYVTGAQRNWIKRASGVLAPANPAATIVPRQDASLKIRLCANIRRNAQTLMLACAANNAASQTKTASRPTFGMRAGFVMRHTSVKMQTGGLGSAADKAHKCMAAEAKIKWLRANEEHLWLYISAAPMTDEAATSMAIDYADGAATNMAVDYVNEAATDMAIDYANEVATHMAVDN
ncbi:hypothetical protein GGH96_005717, partial [Coemansia sp. RSA 1972]